MPLFKKLALFSLPLLFFVVLVAAAVLQKRQNLRQNASGGTYTVSGNKIIDQTGKQFVPYGFVINCLALKQPVASLCQPGSDGPNSGTELLTAASTYWHANVVRFQTAQETLFSGPNGTVNTSYISLIDTMVNQANSSGMIAIITLQEEFYAGKTKVLPDASSLTYWQFMSDHFKNNPHVFFDLFNEPRLDAILVGGADSMWNIWQNGGQVQSGVVNDTFVGMQAVVNTVRATGANNIIVAESNTFDRDLSQIMSHQLTGNNITYGFEPVIHKDGSPAGWDAAFGNFSNSIPLMPEAFREYLGMQNCYPNTPTLVPMILDYLKSKQLGVIVWSLLPGVTYIGNNPTNPTTYPSGTISCLANGNGSSIPGNTIGEGQDILNYFIANSTSPLPTSLTPTSTPVPTTINTLTPTPTPTPSGGSTLLSLNLLLHGIGRGGDSANPSGGGNPNPLHVQRTVAVDVLNSSNTLVETKQSTVNFQSQTGNFTGSVDLGTIIQTGSYSVIVKTDQYLRTLVPGIQTLTAGSVNQLPQTTLIVGDINWDNKIDIQDYNILIGCYSDYLPSPSCTPAQKLAADITDDGHVNQFDYNLFLRELSNRSSPSLGLTPSINFAAIGGFVDTQKPVPPIGVVLWGLHSTSYKGLNNGPNLNYCKFGEYHPPIGSGYDINSPVTWFLQNHPDWIMYQADRKTIAYYNESSHNYIDRSSVPLDVTNPAVQNYSTNECAGIAISKGYNGIGIDHVTTLNRYARAGHFDISGNWIQTYTGGEIDEVYRQAMITAFKAIVKIQRNYAQSQSVTNFVIAVNTEPDLVKEPGWWNDLNPYIDVVFDEHGFTRGNLFTGRVSDAPTNMVSSAWGQIISDYIQLQGEGKKLIINSLVPSVVDAQNPPQPADIQWILSNYLLIKNSNTYAAFIRSGITTSGAPFLYTQQYIIVPEYFAKLGDPAGTYYSSQGIYMRNYSNGLVLVNPSNAAVNITIGKGYIDLGGNNMSTQQSLAATSGLILVKR